jgi:hypothetical protein
MEGNRAAGSQGDQGRHREVAVENEAAEDAFDVQERRSERSDDSAVDAMLQDIIVFDSPQRMRLSDHERDLAINIRAAIAANPEVNPVSDFMCAQLALLDGDNLEEATARVHHLQCFREEYGIMDTAQDGRKCFADYIKLFPKLHLCFTHFYHDGNYVLIYDNAHFDSSQVRSEESLRCWLGGTYYSCAAVCPDFEAIRNGLILMAECEG